MNVFVFDIETVPDVNAGRNLLDLDGLDDSAVASAMFTRRRQETDGNSDFLRHHLHKIVAISAVFRTKDRLDVWSLGSEHSSESELVERFFEGIEKYSPTLVSWNGAGFDLPVLRYRALLHNISAGRYWDIGDQDSAFRYNNYQNRYHWRHIDVMDVISGFQPRAFVPLDEMASLLGFPGKLGMSGADVWECFQRQQIDRIRNYCETDVLNTWLVFLRFQTTRGCLSPSELERELELTRLCLSASEKRHLKEFLLEWDKVST